MILKLQTPTSTLHRSIEHQTPKSATAICRLKLGITLALGVWKVGIFRSNGLDDTSKFDDRNVASRVILNG
ncbi:MAG: hypothetical protein DMF02_00655 [Verrucomicrobia bacterium]|nr:MAG: hypothetical protein DMF02_00655 [Verrucomicrobiota bacterium]